MEKLKDRFKDHELKEILNTENIKVFEFRNKNGSSRNYQKWIIDKGTLIVLGDNYNSIYTWNHSKITLEFLASCNLDYFNEKCRADKDGWRQKEFDSEYAENTLKEIAVDYIAGNVDFSDELEDKWEKLSFEEKFEAVEPYILEKTKSDSWEIDSMFYGETFQDAYEILTNPEYQFMFGSDAWEHSSSLERITIIPKLHLTALRVAFEKYPNAF